MLLLYSIKIAERSPVLEKDVRSIYCVSIVNINQFVCVLLSFLVLRVGDGI